MKKEPPRHALELDIQAQPNDISCGPTCLHAVYRYWGDDLPLDRVIADIPMLPEGGTLASELANHALRRGYRARIYTCKLQLFDPTWFTSGVDLPERLRAQSRFKADPKLRLAADSYIEYLQAGGDLRMEDITGALLRKYLNRNIPLITGLSATYLYRCAREYGPHCDYDDIRGEPTGHFVVLAGYDRTAKTVQVADPLWSNPVTGRPCYTVSLNHLLCAILLGVLTYDATLLVLQPDPKRKNAPWTP